MQVVTVSFTDLQMMFDRQADRIIEGFLNVKSEPEQDRWMNIDQLCVYHPDKPAKQTVYQWLSAGKIPFHKKGKKVYFLKSEIDSWLAEGKRNTRLEVASQVDTFLSSQ